MSDITTAAVARADCAAAPSSIRSNWYDWTLRRTVGTSIEAPAAVCFI